MRSILMPASSLVFILLAIILVAVSAAPSAAASSPATASASAATWASLCNFSSSSYAYPPMRLVSDSYSARGEGRALLVRTTQPWLVPSLQSISTGAGAVCVTRMEYRGFIAPFWLSTVVTGGVDDATITPPLLSALDESDLSWFASCADSVERVNVQQLRVTVTDVAVKGGAWGTTAAANTTMPAGSKCNMNDRSDLTPFLRIFAVVDGGVAEEINLDLSVIAQSADYETVWVRDNVKTACPIYFGAVLDGSICPGTVSFSGAISVSMQFSLTASADVALNWYLYVPTCIPLGLGLFFLVVYAACAAPRVERLPAYPAPDRTNTSIALALCKVCLIVATVVSGVTLAIVLAIDQMRAAMSPTSDALILMGSLFAVCAVVLVGAAGMLAGREDARLKSMPVFIVAWLRLVSRALALGSCCAAWYRGYTAIGIISVVLQFVIEIGFWANLATTFSGSHEPLRFGTPGDQMLVLNEVALAFMFLPFVGVIASAASRVMCTMEMSERFQVNGKKQKQLAEESANGGDDAELEPVVPQSALAPITATKKNAKGGKNKKSGAAAESPSSPKKGNKAGKKKNKKGGGYDESDDDDDDEDENAAAGKQTNAAEEEGDDEEEDLDFERIPFALFPVENTGALAASFEGVLSARWWVILFECMCLAGTSVAIAVAHPPYVPFALLHVLLALAHVGAGFGGVASGPGFGEVDGGAKAVLWGDIRSTCSTATRCSLSHPGDNAVLTVADDLSVLNKRARHSPRAGGASAAATAEVAPTKQQQQPDRRQQEQDALPALPEPTGAGHVNTTPRQQQYPYVYRAGGGAASSAGGASASSTATIGNINVGGAAVGTAANNNANALVPSRSARSYEYTAPPPATATTVAPARPREYGFEENRGGNAFGPSGASRGAFPPPNIGARTAAGQQQQQPQLTYQNRGGGGGDFGHMDSIDERVKALAEMSRLRAFEEQ